MLVLVIEWIVWRVLFWIFWGDCFGIFVLKFWEVEEKVFFWLLVILLFVKVGFLKELKFEFVLILLFRVVFLVFNDLVFVWICLVFEIKFWLLWVLFVGNIELVVEFDVVEFYIWLFFWNWGFRD